ncbi:ankyrin repeat domain-containing protein [Streptomyces sp. NPDC006544]|uniref:ankyrin repeat domain-containing protein n=1 Tax=Streptomyces sp. NPDC006544 TaxID=3154583 RepID=UPI0033A6E179
MDQLERWVRAAGEGDAVLVARLLGEGVEVDAPGADRCTALERAVREGHAAVVRLLLEAGAVADQPTGEYQETTPLCVAAARGHTAVVEALLDAGVHPEDRSRLGHLPLVLAATAHAGGHPLTVDLLLRRGADIDAEMKGRTALDWAAGFGYGEMVRHLLERGAAPRPSAPSSARRDQAVRPPGPG